MNKFKLTHSIAAKTAAYILLVTMALALAASGAGVIFGIYIECYTLGLEEVKTQCFKEMLAYESFNVYKTYERGDTPVDYSENIRFEIYDSEENLLWKTDRKAAEKEYSFSIWCIAVNDFEYSYDYYGKATSNEDNYVTGYVDASFPVRDKLAMLNDVTEFVYTWRYALIILCAASLIAIIILLVFLLCAAGHSAGHEEVVPGLLTRIPLDLLLFVLICAVAILLTIALESNIGNNCIQLALVAACVIASAVLCIFFLCDFAIRVKLGKWWRGSITYMVLRFAWRICRGFVGGVKLFFNKLPLIWKSVAVYGGIMLFESIMLVITYWEMDNYVVIWILEHLLLLPVVVYVTLALRRLQMGGKALAAGDLSSQVDTRYLVWDLKGHAEDLNSIGLGMSRAVEERLKSERLKTELITNVSHDIKTPLTSIINYSDLICREDSGNEKIAEYAEVLHRQSERLKKLIEDLTEASKASTGNIEVLLSPCQAGVLLEQAAGEYEQRLRDCGLELIVKQPEESVNIMADGRHIWRVFDNLMNNVCKYAQPGTRVYLSLEKKQGKAVFSIKNTSRFALDISSDELMERFVRGDSSRSTEGSGLGLSIARSLTELQKGSMELTVDGDLFKVCLSFDAVE